jgi:hypothetical protein
LPARAQKQLALGGDRAALNPPAHRSRPQSRVGLARQSRPPSAQLRADIRSTRRAAALSVHDDWNKNAAPGGVLRADSYWMFSIFIALLVSRIQLLARQRSASPSTVLPTSAI